MDLALNNLQRLICHKTQQTKPNPTETTHGGEASALRNEVAFHSHYSQVHSDVVVPVKISSMCQLIIFIKMDLALNNLQKLICHKTNQPNKQSLQSHRSQST